MSLAVRSRMRLDEVWWLVSPQNPLKPAAGMAPFEARLARARAVARHPRIRVLDIEARLETQLTADTVAALRARFPHLRFAWIMGADNLLQFHLWAAWREIARMVPIVVVARPPYSGRCRRAPAMGWLRRFRRRHAARWRTWPLPSIVFLDLGLDPTSATAIRALDPAWAEPARPGQAA